MFWGFMPFYQKEQLRADMKVLGGERGGGGERGVGSAKDLETGIELE